MERNLEVSHLLDARNQGRVAILIRMGTGELPLDPPVPHFIIQHLKLHTVPIVASPACYMPLISFSDYNALPKTESVSTILQDFLSLSQIVHTLVSE